MEINDHASFDSNRKDYYCCCFRFERDLPLRFEVERHPSSVIPSYQSKMTDDLNEAQHFHIVPPCLGEDYLFFS